MQRVQSCGKRRVVHDDFWSHNAARGLLFSGAPGSEIRGFDEYD